ncbi:MAG: hypothetical protein QG655_3816 [Actinomycetota bacterium]|nr:hypothetical protein [Actinomycetota bacterium]
MTKMIRRGDIGHLDKLGQGGQGVVYKAAKVTTDFSKSMVYKEYHDGRGGRSDVLATLNVAALKAMPEYLEKLPYAQGAKLIKIAAWPCRIVENNGRVSGFVMPSIPDEFFIDLSTAKGSSRVMADFQHILNPPDVVAMRLNGRIITEREKYQLLGKVASALDFLHSQNVCVGDISPLNLLFSLYGTPAVYFVDCDAMRVNGVSLSHQLETPGWEIPNGEEKATPYSDRFKFGLLALRLILGDQDARDPSRLPSSVPAAIRQMITETLKQPPHSRPAWSGWELALEAAAKQAPAQPLTVPIPVAKNTIRPIPPQRGPNNQTPVRQTAPAPSVSPPTTSSQPWSAPVALPPMSPKVKSSVLGWLAAAAAVVFFLVIAKIAVGSSGSGTNAYPSTPSVYPTYTSTPSYEATTPTRTTSRSTPTAVARPPEVTGLDPNNARCDGGYYKTDYSGWGTRSVRGSDRTSCYFTDAVLTAYWAQYPSPSKDERVVYVSGSVDCNSVPGASSCLPDGRFVMTCRGFTNQDWITCTGGNQAVVYLY